MKLRPTDAVILASNGIHTLSTAQVQTTLEQIGDQRPKLLAELLVKAIEQRAHPYQDNATVLAVRHRA